MAKSEIIEAIKLLAKEKDIPEERLFSAIENAMKAAFRKNLPKGAVEPANMVVNVSREDGSTKVYARMTVVEEVEIPASQITLEKAKQLKPGVQMNDIVEVDVTPKAFLRVAAQSAKQVLMTHQNMTEEQAWQCLRKMAMDKNQRMVEIARALLTVKNLWR